MTVADQLDAARASNDWSALVKALPYLGFLGVEYAVHQGSRRLVMRYAEHLVGNPTIPALHGGTLGALLESVAHLECLAASDSVKLPRTITLTVDYLRSAKPADVFAEAQVVKQGRRVTSVHCRAYQEDASAPIATATVHLKVS